MGAGHKVLKVDLSVLLCDSSVSAYCALEWAYMIHLLRNFGTSDLPFVRGQLGHIRCVGECPRTG